jgi:hypothetical protein
VAASAKRRRPLSMFSPRLSTSPSVKAKSVDPGARKVLVELSRRRGSGDREDGAADEDDPGERPAQGAAQGASGRGHQGKSRVAKGDNVPGRTPGEREVGQGKVRRCQGGEARRRAEVGGVVEVGEGRVALDRRPPVGRDGPLGVDGEGRGVRKSDGVCDALARPGPDARHHEGRAAGRAGDELPGPVRGGHQFRRCPQGHERPQRRAFCFPQGGRHEETARPGLGGHVPAELPGAPPWPFPFAEPSPMGSRCLGSSSSAPPVRATIMAVRPGVRDRRAAAPSGAPRERGEIMAGLLVQ